MKKNLLSLIIIIVVELPTVAQNVRVQSGTCLKIGPGSTFDLGTADLILDSDSLSTATLIDIGDLTYTGGGEVRVNRFITPGKWHFISSPVNHAEAGMFFSDYLQQFNETTNQWQDVNSISAPLEIMKGYSLWSTELSSTREVFTGISNTGLQQISFSNGGDGFNLIGNPYPSAIDWNQVSIPSGLNGQFYRWDPLIGNNGDYVYYIQGGGLANTTSQYIPSGQGFFVEANAPGNLQLDNPVRVHTTRNFFKNTEEYPLIILQVAGNDVTTQMAIRFNPSGSNNVDRLLDVRKILSGNPDIPNLYSYSDGTKLAINTLASVKGNEVIDLGFKAGINGEYTIRLSELVAVPDELEILLEDQGDNIIQDLRKHTEYTFTQLSENEKPFRLHLKEANGISSPARPENPAIVANVSNGLLNIRIDEEFLDSKDQAYRLEIFSGSGQLMQQLGLHGTDQSIPFHFSRAVYLVQVTTQKGRFSTKVVHP